MPPSPGVGEVPHDSDCRVIVLADAGWDDFFDAPGVEIERGQLPVQDPEAFWW